MNRIHEELPDQEFEQPSTVERVTICSESGLLAGTGCSRTTEYFDVSNVPTRRCTEHIPIIIPTPNAHSVCDAEPDSDAYPNAHAYFYSGRWRSDAAGRSGRGSARRTGIQRP